MAGVGLAVALLMSPARGLVGGPARVLPGARQGSCRDVAVVPGKVLAGGLVDFLG